MNGITRGIAFVGLATLLRGVSVGAASPEPEACRTEQNDARRLQCYDRKFGGPIPASVRSAGLPETKLEPPLDKSRTALAPHKLFRAKITALRFGKGGAFVATLDNGEEWAQFVAEGTAHIAVGDTVTIWPGWLGSYNLKGPSNWSTKVHPLLD